MLFCLFFFSLLHRRQFTLDSFQPAAFSHLVIATVLVFIRLAALLQYHLLVTLRGAPIFRSANAISHGDEGRGLAGEARAEYDRWPLYVPASPTVFDAKAKRMIEGKAGQLNRSPQPILSL
jgi:hypothetical protein